MAKDENMMVSVAVVFKKHDGNPTKWFIVKTSAESDWELPRTIVRRGESSVRGSLRMTSEQGGMRTRVLEEVGRTTGAARVNNKAVTQKVLYYLMSCREGGEIIGFHEYDWVEYKTIAKKLKNKKDLTQIAKAKDLLKELEGKNDTRTDEETDEFDETEEELV